MNKFTLQFKDSNLEQLYQAFLLEKILHPVFMVLGIFATLILAMMNIDGFINQNQSQFTLKLVGFCILMVVTGVCHFYKRFTRFGLYVFNHFLMIYQINQRTGEAQHTYLFGQNQMFVHAIVMFISDLPDGIIQNITWTIIRLVIANLVSSEIDYQDHIYCIGIFFTLMVCLYIKNQHFRMAYLFSVKDNQWEVLLPSLISKPTFIFTCEVDKLQFKIQRMIQMQFLRDIENPLTYFLRQSRIGNKTLEQYIWDRIKTTTNNAMRYSIENLSIQYNKINQQITLSECQLENKTFILVVDSQDRNVLEMSKQQEIHKERQRLNMLKLFRIQSKIMQRGLKERNFEIMFDLSIALVQLIQRFHIHEMHCKLINFTNLVDSIVKSFQSIRRADYDFQCKQNLHIYTIQPLMIAYLLYLFQNIRQFNNIIVELSKVNGQIQLQILGQMGTQVNTFYLQAERILVKKKILIKPCTILIFNESPLLSFNSKFSLQQSI